MDIKTLRQRAKEIIATLPKLDSRDDRHIAELLESSARYLLVGEHPRYGDQYVWGFRHTLREAAVMFFHHPAGSHNGDLAVRLAYIYDLHSKNYQKPITPGPVDKTVKIGRLTVSNLSGVIGDNFDPGDAVMVRSCGVTPTHFWPGKVISGRRRVDGKKVYMVEYDPWDEGAETYETEADRVFRVDPKRKLPHIQRNG